MLTLLFCETFTSQILNVLMHMLLYHPRNQKQKPNHFLVTTIISGLSFFKLSVTIFHHISAPCKQSFQTLLEYATEESQAPKTQGLGFFVCLFVLALFFQQHHTLVKFISYSYCRKASISIILYFIPCHNFSECTPRIFEILKVLLGSVIVNFFFFFYHISKI